MGSHVKLAGLGGVNNSFNSNSTVNNTSTVTTTNKEIDKTNSLTLINDSYNRGSFNKVDVDVDSHDKTLVIKDNIVNVNSNNQANVTTTDSHDTNTVVSSINSNNTATETNLNSNNVVLTENHLLSDNNVVVVTP